MSNTIKKNQKAEVSTKSGNNYSYQYVDIAQIHEYLEGIGSKYIQQIKRIDNDDYIMTKRCFDDKWEDEWLQGSRVVDATLFGNDNPAQKQGSALTYARRYSLLMAYGLATEDDDANCLNETKEITKEEALKYTFNFGKYAGKKLNEVPTNYLAWLIENKNDARLNTLIKLATGFEILSEEKQKEKIKLIKAIEDLVFEKNLDLEDIKENYNVDSLANLTFEDTKKLYSELRGE